MSELEAQTIDGNEVVDEREDAFSGDTVYTVNDDEGYYMDVDENGNEVGAFSLASPSDRSVDEYVQCDPDGATVITSSSQERMLDHASEMFGVLPSGEVVAALVHDTIVWPHYDDEYVNYRETPLKKAFHRYVSPGDTMMSIEANRYYRPSDDTEFAHTYGQIEQVTLDRIPIRDRRESVKKFIELVKDGNVFLPVPVFIPSSGKLFTHEKYTEALADMIQAEYSV